MLHVTLLSHGFQSEYEIGFANGLARNGVDVLLIGSDNTQTARSDAGVKILNLRGSQDAGRSKLAKLINVSRYVCSYLWFLARSRGRVVHLNGLFSTRFSLVSLLEAWLTRLAAGPYVLTVHDVLPHDGDTAFNRWAYRWLYRAPGTLVAHTCRVAGRLGHEFNVARHRIVVAEHGIDRFFDPAPALRGRVRAAQAIPPDATVALFFGKIMRYKGVDLLLEAFERIGNDQRLHLALVGKCFDPVLLDELHAHIARHPFRARIHWENQFIAEAEIPAVMASADFVVLPYRHIDQSGVLFMALSSGTPLVVAEVGTLAAYVPPAVGETVAPDDADALAAAMARLMARLPTIAPSSVVAHARKYAWENTVQPLLAVYSVNQGRL